MGEEKVVDEVLITVTEASERCGLVYGTLCGWVANKVVPVYHTGVVYKNGKQPRLVKESEVRKVMEARGFVGDQPARRPRRDVLTTGQAATICRVAPRTVAKWIDSGKIKGTYRIPGSLDRRIPADSLAAFLSENGMPFNEFQVGVAVIAAGLDPVFSEAFRAATAFEVDMVTNTFSLGARLANTPGPTIVIFDSALGRGAVLEMAGELSARPPAKRPSLVALCNEDEENPREFVDRGCEAVVSKPADPATLAGVVARLADKYCP